MFGRIAPRAFADEAGLVVFGDQRFHHREHSLVDRRIDDLAPAGLLAVMQRRQRAHAGERRGERVADADADARRRRRRIADDIAQAAHRLADRAEAGAVRVRAGLAVARDPDHDQARVDRRERRVIQAPFLHRAGPEVLEQEIGLRDQFLQHVLAGALAQVERDRLLVAGDDRPPQRRIAVLLPSPNAHRIALIRRLDLDDLGAHVAEQLTAERPREQRAEFQDAQVGQGAVLEFDGFLHGHRFNDLGLGSMPGKKLYTNWPWNEIMNVMNAVCAS